MTDHIPGSNSENEDLQLFPTQQLDFRIWNNRNMKISNFMKNNIFSGGKETYAKSKKCKRDQIEVFIDKARQV